MNSEIKPGARFPDFELPDHTGVDRKVYTFVLKPDLIIHIIGWTLYNRTNKLASTFLKLIDQLMYVSETKRKY